METFGRYELLRKIATGGMGVVYLAREKGSERFEKLLVVKRILPHLAEEPEFMQMFFDEARIAALLEHPNIVRIQDLGEADGLYYIAMEYVEGESLRQLDQRLRQQRMTLPVGLVCRIVSDAAAGFDSAHKAKDPSGTPLALIHRDVSPQNVLVGMNGTVKIIDFGVAKAVNRASHTAAGTIKGKYAYMSPEQARGEPLDCRSDVFGLGVILYEQLTGLRLFKRDSAAGTLKAVMGSKVAPPSSVVPELGAELDALCLQALAKKREERFQSAGELRLALEDFLVHQRLPASTQHLARFMRAVFQGGDEDESTLV